MYNIIIIKKCNSYKLYTVFYNDLKSHKKISQENVNTFKVYKCLSLNYFCNNLHIIGPGSNKNKTLICLLTIKIRYFRRKNNFIIHFTYNIIKTKIRKSK